MCFVGKKKYFYALWLFFTISIAIAYAMQQSIYTPLSQLDGAYQTASGLYRINNGFIPGRDFFPYLGLLITWVLYPFFILAGSNMGASLFSTYLLVFIGTIFSVFTFIFFSKRDNAIVATVLSLLLSFIIVNFYDSLNISLLERVTPGNSLRPLRALVSPLAFFLLYLCVVKINNTKYQLIVASAITGISMTWSNDFGYPTALMCGVTYLLTSWMNGKLRISSFLAFGILSLICYALTSTIMTMGNFIAMIKYNMDIASDQKWYFNTGTAVKNVFSLPQLFSHFLIPAVGYKMLVIPLVLGVHYKTKSLKSIFQLSVGISLFLGAVLPVVGGHVDYNYASAYNLWCYCVIASYLLNIVHFTLKSSSIKLNYKKVNFASFSILLLLGTLSLINASADFIKYKHIANSNPQLFYAKKLGGYISSIWKDYISLDLGIANIQEDYWGIYSANHELFSTAPTDSIIHALGSKRPLYNRSLKNADIVFTVAPEASGMWIYWLISANWDFYSYVLKNYRLEKKYPATDMWVKDKPTQWENQQCIIDNGSVTLPNAAHGYYEVSINYDYSLVKGSGFYMIKNNLNYSPGASGYISINENSRSFIFPALLDPSEKGLSRLDLKSVGYVKGLKIASCTAQKIVDPYNIWFPNLSIRERD